MRYVITFSLALTLVTPALGAQNVAPAIAAYIKVNAPMAQQLVVSIKAAHPEIKKLGLHATPAGTNDNAIIGSDAPAKVGKKSSSKDMEKLAVGKPVSERIDKDGIFDLLLPITDRSGSSIGDGFVVMEVPFTSARTEAEALQIGMIIRDQMQKRIPNREALYRRPS